MAVVLLQVGQCGNQIGCKIFNNLIEEMNDTSECLSSVIKDSYFTIDSKDRLSANAILVDMESKVIEKCIKDSISNGWNYYKENIINKQEGSGNNWANGFFNHGPSIENKVIETFSNFTEKFDYIDSIIAINSLAGGTGSGLGSYINIILKDYFPTINLLNVSVWPHNNGEVIVNSYNTLLSISESYKVSDLLTVIKNQEIYDISDKIHKIKKIGFDSLNSIISKHIIASMLPTLGIGKEIKLKPFNNKPFISEIINSLGIDPRFKFMRIISTPEMPEEHIAFTNNNWNALTGRGLSRLINNSNEILVDKKDPNGTQCKIKAIMTIYRGKDIKDDNISNLFKEYADKNNIYFKDYKDKNEYLKYEKHLTVLSNSNFLKDEMRNTLTKAQEMLENRAYVYQYEKYGMDINDFLDAMSFCEQVNFDYNNLI